jgi:hypothetical protein
MKAAQRTRVIGRTITAVETTRIWNDRRARSEIVVDAILLDDGTRLVPVVDATSDNYHATIIVRGAS